MYSCVIVAAGSGTRVNLGYNKLRYLVKGKPILLYSVEAFLKRDYEVIVVINKEDESFFNDYLDKSVKITYGGKDRSESVARGLKMVTRKFVLIHDAARPRITEKLIDKVENGLAMYSACFLAKRITDTVYQKSEHLKLLDRKLLYQAETPQAFLTKEIKSAYREGIGQFTDDISLYKSLYNNEIGILVHEDNNDKITYQEDIDLFEREIGDNTMRIGQSYDIHQLVEDRKLIIGGVEIPYEKGLLGHSDADVLLHAVAESILGALGLGDLGTFYPDTDPKNKDLDSKVIVKKAALLMKEAGYRIANIDTCVFAEKPKMAPFIGSIKESIGTLLEIELDLINVKAATNEKLDSIGAGKAIAASSIVLLIKE
ncbi:2-C-methyl-D-erythritol 4-phosphate cytidylyltransferase/2-C-methyl-D-erythritol 4-phosphate cytidylyltransferase/2-C-methyl-D-erythritol 2,4-cyclodiphosphate synthase [Acholeplasma morum]|uniref:2-C-methyl-D-erythritol 2,4-cyclodiphosphate synthase n=1 Tax=Paracholeplasma morum TaxID=264637 RepID=UPI00195DD80F|nr:2-C-methyl-D-erythritol 2,4-cyclodiphosphate synthase [Paracholeplasma morum]MBM7453144.1 2-C-methyl-D-erythritol 4-phosphate cytidylyltransferase/2-C-methyl-D-erythritol 4-phosphate cytidylyltransferase/2-C-methyl-D-erythritol 2,4-cyclodiphosphate synthase [Paracholeplasma morum]